MKIENMGRKSIVGELNQVLIRVNSLSLLGMAVYFSPHMWAGSVFI